MILGALSSFWASCAPQMANHLWQSTLFVVLAAGLAFALRRNQGRVRYWVWLTASLKFLLPFSLLIALGSHLARPRVSTPTQAVVYSAVQDFSQPFAAPELPPISQAPAPVSRPHLLPPILVAVWLAGIMVVLLVWAVGLMRVSRIVRRAMPLAQAPEVDALRRLESSLGVRKPIKIVLSPDWMEPGIFGIVRPVLIWPEGISQHLDEKHIDAILAHEICHARRHDNLTAVLHMLVEALFWFHPLVWWVGARLEEERERACDEEVSLLCNQPHIYAESILRVCKFCSESPLACVSGITGADLKQRIVQIMSENVAHKLDRRHKLLLLVAAVAVVAAPLALGLAHIPLALAQILHADGPLPSFEVATIRPVQMQFMGPPPSVGPNGEPIMSQQEFRSGPAFGAEPHTSDRVKLSFATTEDLIGLAYDIPVRPQPAYEVPVPSTQILGGADWIQKTRYQIDAKIDDSTYAAMQKMDTAQKKRQIALMEQSLLAERFKLKVHFETREMPAYALVVAKGETVRLTPAKDGVKPADDASTGVKARRPVYPGFVVVGKGLGFEMTATALSLHDLVPFLQQQPEMAGRVVADQTGLSGTYDFKMNWTREVSSGPADAPSSQGTAPLFLAALKQQLGLQLVPAKVQAEVLVIDHIEKPTVDGAEVATPMPQPVSVVAPLAMAQAKPVATPTAPEQIVTSSGPLPSFEVATIKPDSGGPPPFSIPPQNLFRNFNVTARDLVRVAYGLPPGRASARVFGGPSWIDEDRYDVEGKIPDAILAKIQKSREMRKEQMLLMVQSLLTERFKLAAHVETREMPIYELVVAKGGPKLTPSEPMQPGDDAPPPPPAPGKLPNPADMRQGLMVLPKTRNVMAMTAKGETMDDLSQATFFGLDRPVINKTGLTGRYDFTLDWSPGQAGPAASALDAGAEAEAPSFPTALEEQLGLRLVSTKGPVGVIVIDHIEKPSAN